MNNLDYSKAILALRRCSIPQKNNDAQFIRTVSANNVDGLTVSDQKRIRRMVHTYRAQEPIKLFGHVCSDECESFIARRRTKQLELM